MYCSSCGSENQDGRYCSECGSLRYGPAAASSKNSAIENDSKPRQPQGAPPRVVRDTNQKFESNAAAPWALGFGIASAFFYEFFFPMLIAIPLAIVGMIKASEFKRVRADKTGFAQSVIGLVLGLVYLFASLVVALGFGP